MPVRSRFADLLVSRTRKLRLWLRRVTVVMIFGVAIFGGDTAADSEDLYGYFARIGDEPLPSGQRLAAPVPRNDLPTDRSDRDGSRIRPSQQIDAEAEPSLTVPPRNAVPVLPDVAAPPTARPPIVPPRNEFPGESESTPADEFPPAASAEDVRSGPPSATAPAGAPPADIGPTEIVHMPIGWQPRYVAVLPQDLPMLTYMDRYCCWPAPPLEMPSGSVGGGPWMESGRWSAYSGWETGGDVACADPVLPCDVDPLRRWRFSGGGLVLVPDGGSDRRLSFSTADPSGSLLHTGDADAAGGVEFAITRLLTGGGGLEVKYWGVYPADQTSDAVDPVPPGGALPNLNTTLSLSTLDFDNGVVIQSVDNFFDGAQRHRLIRAFEVHNLELNVHVPLSKPYDNGRSGWLGGIRYFDLNEPLDFWSDPFNTVWGDDPSNELAYKIDVENRLMGVQLGVFFDQLWTPVVHLTGSAKAGVYNNDIKFQTRLGNIVTPAVVGAGVFAGQPYDLTARSDDVAYLGEAELGLAFDLSWQWQVAIGYKSVVLAGIALAPDQMATNFNNLSQAAAIDSSGTLLLHGGYARLERNW